MVPWLPMVRRIQVASPQTGTAEWNAIKPVLESGWLTQGPKLGEFEASFAKRHSSGNGIACSSGTTALHLILAGMGIGPRDQVILPSFSWIAAANAVLYCGAIPILVDVDPGTYNLDPESVQNKLNPHTKAVIAVHQFGLCADVKALWSAIGSVPLIEDAACAAGSASPLGVAGSLGKAASFSFHARKVISMGEGGLVTTNDETLANQIRLLRNHGGKLASEPEFEMPTFDELGFNYRMTDIQAAMGLVQLSKLDSFVEERSRWAQMYEDGLKDVEWLRTPQVCTGYTHAWQSYVCRVDPESAPKSRKEIMRELANVGVQTRAGTHAIHMSDYYRKKFSYNEDDLPVARDLDRQTLALPMHNRLSEDDISFVINTIKEL